MLTNNAIISGCSDNRRGTGELVIKSGSRHCGLTSAYNLLQKFRELNLITPTDKLLILLDGIYSSLGVLKLFVASVRNLLSPILTLLETTLYPEVEVVHTPKIISSPPIGSVIIGKAIV